MNDDKPEGFTPPDAPTPNAADAALATTEATEAARAIRDGEKRKATVGDTITLMSALAGQLEDWVATGRAEAMPLVELIGAYWSLKEQYRELDRQRKRVYAVLDRLDKGIVPEALDAAGTDMVRIPEMGRSFSIRTNLSASFHDKDAGIQWLRDIGQGDMVQETVNAGTLASMVSRMIKDEGLEPPEEIVKVNPYRTIGSSKYTPK